MFMCIISSEEEKN